MGIFDFLAFPPTFRSFLARGSSSCKMAEEKLCATASCKSSWCGWDISWPHCLVKSCITFGQRLPTIKPVMSFLHCLRSTAHFPQHSGSDCDSSSAMTDETAAPQTHSSSFPMFAHWAALSCHSYKVGSRRTSYELSEGSSSNILPLLSGS